MGLLNRGIAALVLLLAASAASAQGRSNWFVYAPKGPGFKVELPAQPTITSGNIKTTHGPARATYFFFKGENGLEGRMEVRDYAPGQISKDPRGYLDESRGYFETRSMASEKPLRSESRFTLEGAPAHRFVADTADGRGMKVQEMVVGDRFISVICFTKKGQENSADVDRILKSFALTKS
jgi:hypothetical protein